ncbi:hypothetical protein FB00_10595 [Cellulosimicrobium funkei]|uniref:Uncharacterized protein n=1 Tax=Cellulosimicrobium funkei TaxID=264251 RepID=A0A0H2KMK1_9MICO|nr:hypothetical protein FB00_10595 [Cellulosimicrobium funkei]
MRSVTAATTRNTSATRTPASSAVWAAAWMTGPSITGSVYGMPSSSTSTPDSTSASAASIDRSTVGNPTGR